MTRTILLTGGAGYIGSHTYVELKSAGFDVVIVDNFSNARADVIDRLAQITDAPVTAHKGDVLDRTFLASVFARHPIDAVIHFAAKKAVGESVEKPLDYFETNCTGFSNVLMAMRDANVFNVVFSSTATVYGEPQSLPYTEDHRLAPVSPYAQSKVTCETLLRQLKDSDPRWTYGILRYFNPAGAHDSALIGEDPNDIPNNLMPYIAKVATGELAQLTVFGDDYDTPDGTGVRDYIHVVDLARGHVQSVAKLLDEQDTHVLNLGTGTGYSVFDMLRSYERACGKALAYQIGPRRAGDIDCFYADPTTARDYLGFQATRDLDDMCRSSWNWVSRLRNS
ncbi:UDP-glucose 4-epimerase GalE [uncultured Maritimibacter sp.]|jgi:UDP-glucose 4-epimerase|uniref:UDP-glucose 4-epimerase GalE n=1 Tax=uncultured Maritimibacter sp. TaxID=991866 RepID=UPI000A5903F8|nr:UDP-glucose 4-epimerase GalE [uncultured Maritimibacter sp.]